MSGAGEPSADHQRPARAEESIVATAATVNQLDDHGVAAAALFALSQQPHVSVDEVQLRPTDQVLA